MKESTDQPRKASTCLEDASYAERMQKIMGEQGIGSLSEERMKSSMSPSRKANEAPEEADKEEGVIASLMKLHKCSDCAIRCKASRKPRSLFARIHRWHATWWPGWKLYQAELRARGAKAMPNA